MAKLGALKSNTEKPRDIHFYHTDFRGADFRGADFTDADLRCAFLNWSDIRNALSDWQTNFYKTRLPLRYGVMTWFVYAASDFCDWLSDWLKRAWPWWVAFLVVFLLWPLLRPFFFLAKLTVPARKPPEVPEIVKKDCQRLVDGQVLFEPEKTMRAGTSYLLFARLTSASGINIAEGLEGTQFAIVKGKVACIVSVGLNAEEPGAFLIEKLPMGRRDDQFLDRVTFSQLDWRVTPRKHGSLHLLLYVTPILYVDGIGEQLKNFAASGKSVGDLAVSAAYG